MWTLDHDGGWNVTDPIEQQSERRCPASIEANDVEDSALSAGQFSCLLLGCIGFSKGAVRLGGQVPLQVIFIRLSDQEMFVRGDEAAGGVR